MGKSLKGKELGIGISQRQDGIYTGRITMPDGKREQKYFKKLQECRRWVEDQKYSIAHRNILCNDMTVETWFNYWFDTFKKPFLKENSILTNQNKWEKHIKPVIGDLLINDIKPIQCTIVLQKMSNNGQSKNSITGVRALMNDFFMAAEENEIIDRNPITRSVKAVGKRQKEARVLSVREQKEFLERMQGQRYYDFFVIDLQTGLRVSEMCALTWKDIDFKRKRIYVNKTCYIDENNQKRVGSPKTENGKREIPMTNETFKILQSMKAKRNESQIVKMEYKDYVFLNSKGNPYFRTGFNTCIRDYCEKYNVPLFSVHTLRHTYATRCIEAGIRPKTLQKLLGHSNIETTMNMYVHVTEKEKENEIEKLEKYLNVL